jgi:hypothetical protein
MKTIKRKIENYIKEDEKKGRYIEERYVTADYIYDMLIANPICGECGHRVELIYSYGDLNQFSVDRLDNNRGHNKGNVRITCLQCNLACANKKD